KLPLIMQLLKQTFAVRLNVLTGRRGHVWGNAIGRRSWRGSRLSGRKRRTFFGEGGAIDRSANTPVARAAAYILTWDSLRSPGMTITTRFSAQNATKPASPPD
ncbi:MAG: hypothetical protein LBG27_07520, partial [Spirochaetaceae bacterium]|nr:hypothetical protein [Spirochaetaceae bacterium]